MKVAHAEDEGMVLLAFIDHIVIPTQGSLEKHDK